MKTKPVKASNVWACNDCPEAMSLSFEQLLTHAKEKHNKDLKGKPAKRSMLMHLDGEDYFSSTWEVVCEGLTLTNTTVNPRKETWWG